MIKLSFCFLFQLRNNLKVIWKLNSVEKCSFGNSNLQKLRFSKLRSVLDKKICKVSRLKGGSRAAATSKMECFVIIVNGLPLLLSNIWMPFITCFTYLGTKYSFSQKHPFITRKFPADNTFSESKFPHRSVL